jgi:hypothetical protein
MQQADQATFMPLTKDSSGSHQNACTQIERL